MLNGYASFDVCHFRGISVVFVYVPSSITLYSISPLYKPVPAMCVLLFSFSARACLVTVRVRCYRANRSHLRDASKS